MTETNQPEIDELLLEALEREPEERRNYLDAVCAGDASLRRELDSLIAVNEKADGFLEQLIPIRREIGDAPDVVGTELGAYRVRGVLGTGGMGTVYLADRSDELFQKEVAIKVVRHGMNTGEMVRKFANERRVLASLEHPHIARLLDAGVTSEGAPYLVMEYVDGVELPRYCNDNGLSVHERLRIFQTVCVAVQHAHQNLVVHRDLKPSNILVTAEGEVKLLDFGISKVLDPTTRMDVTQTVARMLTPRYASPEQVTNRPITTASDVYSLGVILYELLACRHPYPTVDMSPSEIERLICETIPTKPSEVVLSVRSPRDPKTEQGDPVSPSEPDSAPAPRRLARQLEGDLDNIVLKAISKEPERRYASPDQLSEDIERHLRGLPVLARPDTLRYRTGKFVRRNRVGVVLVSILFVALGLAAFVNAAAIGIVSVLFLVVGLGALVSTVLFLRATDARRKSVEAQAAAEAALVEAETQRRTAEAVSGFLQEMFMRADPTRSQNRESPTVSEVMGEAGSRIERELAHQPEVAAALYHTIGMAQREMAQYEPAETNLRAALAIRSRTNRTPDADSLETMLALARVLFKRGELDETESLLREVIVLQDGPSIGSESGRAQSRQYLCDVLVEKGRLEEAEALGRAGLSIRRALLQTIKERGDEEGGELEKLAGDLTALGLLLVRDGRPSDAEPYLREALDRVIEVRGENHSFVGQARANVGWVLIQLGNHGDAIPYLERALELHRSVYADDHPNVLAPSGNLAHCYQVVGRYEEAVKILTMVANTMRRTMDDNHPNVGHAVHNLGFAILEGGDAARARPLLEEASEIYTRAFGEEHAFRAIALFNTARALVAEGRLDDAERVGTQSLSMRRRVLRENHPDIARSTRFLGGLLLERGRLEEAEILLRETVEIREVADGTDHPLTLQARELLERCSGNSRSSSAEETNRD